MSKYIVDIYGEIEGDYEIVGKYEEQEPTTKNNLAHNLCDSCTNIRCELQSGIVRTKCAFYMPPQHSSGLEKNSKKLEKDIGESDCISRADAIRAMQDKAKKLTNEDTINGLCRAVAILFDLPSVTPIRPIRPKGHWKDIPKYKDIAWQCSECEHFTTTKYNYCPNCGAKMESEEI